MSDNLFGYTPVDHVIIDVIMPLLTLSAQAIYLRIYRQTVGWHKNNDYISNSEFRKSTGIAEDKTVRNAIRELAMSNLIIINAVSGIANLREVLNSSKAGDWRAKNYSINDDVFEVYRRLAKHLK